MNLTAISEYQGQKNDLSLTGPAMEKTNELRRRGLVTGDGQQIPRFIDHLTALLRLRDTLMDPFNAARLEVDAVALRRYILNQTWAALDRTSFEFSYFDDGSSRLSAMGDRLWRRQ